MIGRSDPPGHEAWPGPLTDREHEVARLVATALSNRAIGETLDISQATAARHVANIFAKLGFSSRAQLIAWVLSGDYRRSYMRSRALYIAQVHGSSTYCQRVSAYDRTYCCPYIGPVYMASCIHLMM